MEGLVISTRSFNTNTPFIGNNHKEITNLNGIEIEQSNWRKISLPIYMLDLFSEVGTDNIITILRKTYPYSKLPDVFNCFIKDVSDWIAEDDEKETMEKYYDEKEKNCIQTIYNHALFIRSMFRKLMRNKDFKERFTICFSNSNKKESSTETIKYRFDDLINDHNTLFGCYECTLNKKEYPFSPAPYSFYFTKLNSTITEDQTLLDVSTVTSISSEYKCFVIRSFNRRISIELGKRYLKYLKELFGHDMDFLIHDYDYGKRLLQSSFRPPKQDNVLLFKHNKGDVFQILNGTSFSLLYLYVKFGYDLKSYVQKFVMKIEKKLLNNYELAEHYNYLISYCKFVKKESEKLPRKERNKITPSIINLENCLAIGIYNKKCLHEMMFNLMILDDYVLRNIKIQK